MTIITRQRNNKKRASTLVFVIFFFIIFLAFAAFAVDGTIVLTNRFELQSATESAALAAASEFYYGTNPATNVVEPSSANVEGTARSVLNNLKVGSLRHAKVNSVDVNPGTKQVLVQTNLVSQPFFLSFLGISGINLSARACAVCEPLDVTSNYSSGANKTAIWLNQNAIYYSDILSQNLNFHDTAILRPLGTDYSASYPSTDVDATPSFDFINATNANQPLSLGPGGFITIKLPAPIIDKPGFDLLVREAGVLEGYMVFAGLDNNPYSPYIQADNRGAGISWVNITCSARPEISSTAGNLITSIAATNSTVLNSQPKFYGSAFYDIGDSCVNGGASISMAKYIRIIDDNQETGFASANGNNANPRNFYKVMLYGDSSTVTAGADIDQVTVLNHVRLMQAKEYTPYTPPPTTP